MIPALSMIFVLAEIPELPASAVTVFLPVLYAVMFLVAMAAGLWAGFAWLRARIREIVIQVFAERSKEEQIWKDAITNRQEAQAASIVSAHRRVDEVAESVRELMFELVRGGIQINIPGKKKASGGDSV